METMPSSPNSLQVAATFLPLQRAEFIAARRIEHRCAAAVDDMRDIAVFQNHKIAVDQAVITAADADTLDLLLRG